MGRWSITRLAVMGALVVCASGCAFSIPDPPTATRRLEKPIASSGTYNPANEYERLSPFAELVIDAPEKGDSKLRRLAADAVWRCENRLNTLVGRMRAARNTRSGITLTGGILTTVGALMTTVFVATSAAKDGDSKDLDIAAIVSGSLTAAASIATLVGTQIEDPSNLKSLYEASLVRYNYAYGYLIDLNRSDLKGDWNDIYFKALAELNQCSREEVSARSAPDLPKPPTTPSVPNATGAAPVGPPKPPPANTP